MKTVHKYAIDIDDEVAVDMPSGAQILHVGDQYGRLCIWALVDPEAREVPRRFRIAGTGHRIADPVGPHVGSVLFSGGALVLHLFELEP